MEEKLQFFNKNTGENYLSMSLLGATFEEIESTTELLAFERNVKKEDISCKIINIE